MSEERLVKAMTLGSTSPLEQRAPEDLGRFGLGLKTASFSQCKLLTVATKTDKDTLAVRFWDLDYVETTKKWMLGKTLEPSVAGLLKPLDNLNKGTAVIWKELDRVIDRNDGVMHDPKQSFLNKFFYVKEYLEMVFHQYLESRTNKLKIHVGIAECEPWDPYLRNNNLKQELSSEKYVRTAECKSSLMFFHMYRTEPIRKMRKVEVQRDGMRSRASMCIETKG